MNNKKRGLVLMIIFLCLCLLMLLVIVVLLYMQFSPTTVNKPSDLFSPAPVVEIIQPVDGSMINFGDGLLLGATAFSETGVERIDLLVDGLLEQQFTPVLAGEPSSVAVFPWFASQTGWHMLSVVAYDVQGKASSPAEVRVGVQVSAGLPDIVMLPSGDANADPVGEAAPPADGGNPGQDPPVQPQGDQPLPELPVQPLDAPPHIQRFEVFVDLFIPEGGDPVARATVVGSALDDLGLQSLKLSWQSDSGHAGNFSRQCGGGLSCEMEMESDLDVGEWVFTMQAFDTSGQASPPNIQVVEVLGNEGQPPAIAEHGFDEDWFRDHINDNLPDIHIEDSDMPGLRGFDIQGFLDSLFPNARPEPVEAEGDCVNLSIEPSRDGNLLTAQIMCDLQVEGEGQSILPHVSKYLVNTGDGGIGLFIQDWKDFNRTRLSVGDTFTWLDQDVTCGTDYSYALNVTSASLTDMGIATGENHAYARAEVRSQACVNGSLGDVNFRAAPDPEGVLVRWDIAPNGNWPDTLPIEGVTFIVTRFDLVSHELEELFHQNIPPARLMAGGEFEALDDYVQCGSQVIYSLAAIAADADLNLVSPGWLLRSQTNGLDIPCPADSIGELELNLTPYWLNESFVRMRMQTQLPAGFDWRQDQGVEIEIQRTRQDLNRCEAAPCRGIWQVKERIPITDAIRSNGLLFEDDDTSVTYGGYTYVYRLALIVDGVEVEFGPGFSAKTPPAPPPPPEILRLTLSNTCPGGVPRCVTIEWQAYQQPRRNGYYSQAASIAVERVIGAIDQKYFPVGMADTRFVDLEPFMQELEMQNHQVRQICRYDTVYRMVAFDADGHTFGASPLVISTPACNEPWNAVVESR